MGTQASQPVRRRNAPARWWILEGDRPSGPIGIEQVRQLVLDGVVAPRTYVWADGMPQWMPASEVPALTPPSSIRGRIDGWA